MKGMLQTKDFLKSILDKEVGLRSGAMLSHVAVFEIKGIDQLLFMTDGGFVIEPSLEDKVHLIENAVKIAQACGIEKPKVATLCAVDVVNPKMRCTVEGKKLTEMNGKTITEVPAALKLDFLLKPIKVITLSDKSDFQVRFDLFQRLNTGGITLTDQEIRNCVFKGSFNDFIKRLSEDERLRRLTKKPKSAFEDGTYEELVLRFFAYLYGRDLFEHNVKDFLNKFMKWAITNYSERDYEAIFNKVFDELSGLQDGIVKIVGRKNSSTVFWEAVTVGAAEALLSGHEHINLLGFYEWAVDPEFNRLVTGATNSRPMIDNRIRFAREKFSMPNV